MVLFPDEGLMVAPRSSRVSAIRRADRVVVPLMSSLARRPLRPAVSGDSVRQPVRMEVCVKTTGMEGSCWRMTRRPFERVCSMSGPAVLGGVVMLRL